MNFSVIGIAKEHVYGRNGEPQQGTFSEFRFDRGGSKWRLQMDTCLGDSKAAPGPHTRTEAGCDGTNVFILTLTGGTFQDQKFDQGGLVTKGPVPLFGSHGGLIWLAFASGSVLSPTETKFRPIYEGYKASGSVPIYVTEARAAPGFPEQIIFLKTNPLTGKLVTNATFVAAAYTNTAGRTVPQSVSLSVSNLIDGTPHLAERQELQVGAVSSDVPIDFVPMLNRRPTLVHDARFEDQGEAQVWRQGITYVERRWLSTAEVQALPNFREYMLRAAKTPIVTAAAPSTRSLNAAFARLVFLLVAASPLVFIFLRLKRRREE